jgi:uncharacterized protein (DUF302 family)
VKAVFTATISEETMPGSVLKRITQRTYEEALALLPELLKAEGFGVLTRIDVQGTLKAKLGTEFRKYEILGACNQLAHLVLSDLEVGTMLPCNVVVYEGDGGHAVVLALDPSQAIASANPAIAPIGAEVRARLERVIAALG